MSPAQQGQIGNNGYAVPRNCAQHSISADTRPKILTDDELTPQRVTSPADVQQRALKALSRYRYTETHTGRVGFEKRLFMNPSCAVDEFEFELYREFEYGCGAKTGIHRFFKIINEEGILCPELYQSARVDENIKGNSQCVPLPVMDLIICREGQNPFAEYCFYVPMHAIGAIRDSSDAPSARYLSTAGLNDCHCVIFWDESSRCASMAHHTQTQLLAAAFDIQLDEMETTDPSRLKAFVVGGHTHKMGWEPNFFDCIEVYLKERGITLHQTYLGNHSNRPRDVLFDAQTGTLYQMCVTENPTDYRLDLFDANLYNLGKPVTKRIRFGVKAHYRIVNTSDKTLQVPVIATPRRNQAVLRQLHTDSEQSQEGGQRVVRTTCRPKAPVNCFPVATPSISEKI